MTSKEKSNVLISMSTEFMADDKQKNQFITELINILTDKQKEELLKLCDDKFEYELNDAIHNMFYK